MSLKIDMYVLLVRKFKYLGQIVRLGTAVDQGATKSLREEKPPITLTHQRSFLGFVNVYRRLISDYTEKAQTLYEMLKVTSQKDIPEISSEQEAALNILIAAVLDSKSFQSRTSSNIFTLHRLYRLSSRLCAVPEVIECNAKACRTLVADSEQDRMKLLRIGGRVTIRLIKRYNMTPVPLQRKS